MILIGEVRDKETLEVALHAAETGHLVFATLHTQRATMSINRMISMFPAHQQEEVWTQLSQILRAVICQRLVVIDDRFIPVRDILIKTSRSTDIKKETKGATNRIHTRNAKAHENTGNGSYELRSIYGSSPVLESVLAGKLVENIYESGIPMKDLRRIKRK